VKNSYSFSSIYDFLRIAKPYRTGFETHSALALGKEGLGIVGLNIIIFV
jgi:hypothetical protein